MGHLRRQIITAALTANALRPSPGLRRGVLSFLFGWTTVEWAPHLIALTAADTAISTARGKQHPVGVALSALSIAGLASMVHTSRGVADTIHHALEQGLGVDDVTELDAQPTPAEWGRWRHRLNPLPGRHAGVKVTRNIAYTDSTSRRARLDVHVPVETPEGPAPVLVQIHGGGWVLGSKESQGMPLVQHMAAQGWVCVSVNYRFAPKHRFPTQIIDVKRALAWVKEHISEYGGDPDYVVLTGGSAGGHLTALAAVTANEPEFQPGFEDADTSVRAALPIYPVTDFAGATGLKSVQQMRDHFLAPVVIGKPYEGNEELFEAASPILRIHADVPDIFVIHGDKDSLVDVSQARLFTDELRRTSKNSVVYAELPGAQHAFDIFHSIRSGHVVRAVGRYLNWHWNRYRAGLPTERDD